MLKLDYSRKISLILKNNYHKSLKFKSLQAENSKQKYTFNLKMFQNLKFKNFLFQNLQKE
jgi:hypothetical protein